MVGRRAAAGTASLLGEEGPGGLWANSLFSGPWMMAGWRVSVGNCGSRAPPSWPPSPEFCGPQGRGQRSSASKPRPQVLLERERRRSTNLHCPLECTELWDEISELARTGRLRLHCHRDGQAVTQLSRCQRAPSEPTLRFREEAALGFSHLAPPIRLCEPFGLGSLLGLQVHFLREGTTSPD